jgi:DNA polymerase-1
VHDELIVECLEQDAQLVCDILKFEMENATKMAVTLTADAAFGKTWLGSKL